MSEGGRPSGSVDEGSDSPRAAPALLAGSFFILAVLAAWYASPQLRYVQVHDYLDSNHARLKVMSELDLFRAPLSSAVPPLMNGVPRDALENELKFLAPAYMLFPAIAAFLVNEVFSRLLAFFGLFLLLRAHFREEAGVWIAVGVSALYALLPVYPGDPYAQPILPLGAWAALSLIRHRHPVSALAVFGLMPCAGAFAFVIPSYGCLAVLPLLHGLVVRRRPHPAAWFAPLLLLAGFLVSDYRIFHLQLLEPDYVAHRAVRAFDPISVSQYLQQWAGYFVHGHYHLPSLHGPVILISVLAGAGIARLRFHGVRFRRMTLLLVAAGSIAGLAALQTYLWAYPGIFEALRLKQLSSLNYGRIYGLLPLIWYLLFAFSLQYVLEVFGKSPARLVVAAVLMLQFAVIWNGSHWNMTRQRYGATISEFYSEPLFREIREHIGKDPSSYRVLSVGLFPTIALYNGFYCLDGYLSSYSLEYKEKFREIIAPELEKDEAIREYFDHWGNRAYAFSSELGRSYFFTRDKEQRLKDWDIDEAALYELGGRYVLAAVPIDTAARNGLELERVFERADSPWRIWLYRVPSPTGTGGGEAAETAPEEPGASPAVEASAIDFGAAGEEDYILSSVIRTSYMDIARIPELPGAVIPSTGRARIPLPPGAAR